MKPAGRVGAFSWIWRWTLLFAGIAAGTAALITDRLLAGLLILAGVLLVAWVIRIPTPETEVAPWWRKEQPSPAPPVRARDAPRPTSITLRAADEAQAVKLVDDAYFRLGVLMTNGSPEAQRFRDALSAGGTVSGAVTPVPGDAGGYVVTLVVTPAANAPNAPCPYCAANLSRGGGVRIKASPTPGGEQAIVCPECGHALSPRELASLHAAAGGGTGG